VTAQSVEVERQSQLSDIKDARLSRIEQFLGDPDSVPHADPELDVKLVDDRQPN
jgi:hypothetical protein